MPDQTAVLGPVTTASDWRVTLKCPVDGRYYTVTPADFVLVQLVNCDPQLHILTKCLCGGMHTLEVE